ncbi:MAG: ATP-binding cassette domain-containing protein [Candidatus Omnitrophica bacterium]|nr:ATP-binding cassette domain-containing protein [Candidatus Omnitrophota bacterium]
MQVERSALLQDRKNEVMISVQNVSKHFGQIKALDQISFEVKCGEILGFLGPNGAGKTTAMRILTGFFPPTSGKVWIDGREFFKDPRQAKRTIGYLPETLNLYPDMRVREFLKFVAELRQVAGKKRRSHLDEILSRCGLWNVKHRLIGFLSKGYRQRVGLAQALIGDPSVVILDEPTSGLDPKQIIEIRSLIRELGRERTLILSTHILPEVSMVCDRVLIINQGKVVASGTVDELEAGLKEQHQIYVAIGDIGKKEDALNLLHSLEGAEQICITDEKAQEVGFSLIVPKGLDLRPIISRLFVEHQIPLLEIRSARLSLEEIFMKIVVDETRSGAAL